MSFRPFSEAHGDSPQLEPPLPRLFTALKVWECKRRSHQPSSYLLSPLYFTPLLPPRPKPDGAVYTEKQLLRKIKETVQPHNLPTTAHPRSRSLKPISNSISPKVNSTFYRKTESVRFRVPPPLQRLRPGNTFKLKKFRPLFSERVSLSTTPEGSKKKCGVQKHREVRLRDAGTFCNTMEGDSIDGWIAEPVRSYIQGAVEEDNRET